MTRILLEYGSGKVGVMAFGTRAGNPTDAMIDAAIARMPHTVVRWQRIDEKSIPKARRFREAWCFSDSGIEVSLARAKEVYRGELRARRAPVLARLDVAYQRADESADSVEKLRVADVKQKLRDITRDARIDAVTSIEELDALVVWDDDDGAPLGEKKLPLVSSNVEGIR